MTSAVSGRAARLTTALEQHLMPTELAIRDDSHLHVGHAGALGGGSHFAVLVRSAQFRGLTLLQRHRLVYTALGDMMGSEIHALSIQALAPED